MKNKSIDGSPRRESGATLVPKVAQVNPLPEWKRRQDEYHRRKLALWENGVSGDHFTHECRDLRAELGLVPEPESAGEQLDCPRCGPSTYSTRSKGPHTQALCNRCGRHIKFLPKPFDWDALDLAAEVIPFGVHRGKTFKQIAEQDPTYIRYLAREGGGKYRALADEAIMEYGL